MRLLHICCSWHLEWGGSPREMALMKSGLKRSSLQMNPTWRGLAAAVLRSLRSERLASLAVLGLAGKS
jgi:hypothetical protein